jgi:hypothetical protein
VAPSIFGEVKRRSRPRDEPNQMEEAKRPENVVKGRNGRRKVDDSVSIPRQVAVPVGVKFKKILYNDSKVLFPKHLTLRNNSNIHAFASMLDLTEKVKHILILIYQILIGSNQEVLQNVQDYLPFESEPPVHEGHRTSPHCEKHCSACQVHKGHCCSGQKGPHYILSMD